MTHFRRARTKPHRDRRPPRGWLAQLARGLVTRSLAAAVVPAVAGCSGAASQVKLPPKPPDATPAAIVQRAPTQRQRVLAAFAGYTVALHAADVSGDATR